MFLAPNPRECYICYHDSAPQVIVVTYFYGGYESDNDESDNDESDEDTGDDDDNYF